jgi:hypothetical protein
MFEIFETISNLEFQTAEVSTKLLIDFRTSKKYTVDYHMVST